MSAPVSPDRAVYEEFQRVFPAEDWGPWELLDADDREGWRRIAERGATAGLAGAREQLAAVRDLAVSAEQAPVFPRKRFTHGVQVALARRILAVLDSNPEAPEADHA